MAAKTWAGNRGAACFGFLGLFRLPVKQPTDWLTWVNEPQTKKELEALRESVIKGKPFGDEKWQARTVEQLGLQSSQRRTGRPKEQVDP